MTAGSGELERSSEESWQMMVYHAAAGVDQLRVSSPESDASKDGRWALGPGIGRVYVQCTCTVQYHKAWCTTCTCIYV